MTEQKRQARPSAKAVEDEILATAHELGAALHSVGATDEITMRELDQLCLPPPRVYGKSDVVRIRRRTRMSQPVFAKLLGVGKSAVVQWELGTKKPSGTALRVLELLDPEASGSALLEVREISREEHPRPRLRSHSRHAVTTG
ncbi:helix-turn-helix domain-containing protein [Siccirubricoccus phaeus]|uniref:helix-turn-helix domain-containing protein n=1 Tax=Siccirubricoccus phaeus TaxID=2595053 RepID=UPI00165AC138|nr:hypothetical protein [Siccirubricoccus phaeus]